MYLVNEPAGHSDAFEVLDQTFGSESFSRADALEALRTAGVNPETLEQLIRSGCVEE